VIEVYAGERPSDADLLLGPVVSRLSRSGVDVLEAVTQRIETQVSQTSAPSSDEAISSAASQIDAGYNQFIKGRFDKAIEEIGAGLKVLRSSPVAIAQRPQLRDAIMRGLIGFALAHKRRGHSEVAVATMAELIRSFPDREISYNDYGPEPRQLYQDARKDLDWDGKGRLSIEVDDDSTLVFLNERYVGVGNVGLADLYPGVYRVLLQQGRSFGRVHTIRVDPDHMSKLVLSWRLDASLHTEEGRAMLMFNTDGSRRRLEVPIAVSLARTLDAPSVVVLSVRANAGRRSVVGAVFPSGSTRPVRSGAVAVEPVAPSVQKLDALGRLLAGDQDVAELVTPLADEGQMPPAIQIRTPEFERGIRSRWYADRTGWILTGAGSTAAAIGLVLLVGAADLHDEADAEDRETVRSDLQNRADTRQRWGATAMVAGGIAAVSGIVKLALTPNASGSDLRMSLDVGPRYIRFIARF
jgi:hypothetical protein